MEFFRSRKQNLFPWIKDFTDPQDKLRNSKLGDLTYMEWFWFHPTAYNLIMISIPFLAFLNCGIMGLVFFKYKIIFFMNLALSLIFLYGGIKKARLYKLTKDTTFFDVFVREYKQVK